MSKKKQTKPKNTTCYTHCVAEWKCPYCRKYQSSIVDDEFSQKELVKCNDCKRDVLITEE